MIEQRQAALQEYVEADVKKVRLTTSPPAEQVMQGIQQPVCDQRAVGIIHSSPVLPRSPLNSTSCKVNPAHHRLKHHYCATEAGQQHNCSRNKTGQTQRSHADHQEEGSKAGPHAGVLARSLHTYAAAHREHIRLVHCNTVTALARNAWVPRKHRRCLAGAHM